MIYFAQFGDGGHVKIGYSKDPYSRLGQFRNGSPIPVKFLSIIEGDRGTEKEIHTRFACNRIRGEFFALSGELSEYIASLPPAHSTRRIAKRAASLDRVAAGEQITYASPKEIAETGADFLDIALAAAERGKPLTHSKTGWSITKEAVYLTAEAQRVYNAEARMPNPDVARERGALAGEVNRSRRMDLGRTVQSMWNGKLAGKYRTNQDAADAVSLMLGRKVSVPTLRRRFGASGRAAGWPTK
jgi:hypothetical protein